MQGIEPKFHSNLTERMEHYRWLVKQMAGDADGQSGDIISRASELGGLYEDYLITKRKLEQTIKNYRKYNNDLRKLMNIKMRELKKTDELRKKEKRIHK